MKHAWRVAVLSCAAFIPNMAMAAPTLSSGATAVSVNLTAASIVKANVTAATASGSAGAAYDNPASVAAINQTANLVASVLANGFTSADESLTTGLITARAYSSLPSSATGMAEIDNANAKLTTKVLSALPLLSLGVDADVITSQTTAGFNGSGLYATGSSTLTGLGVGGSVLGLLTINGSLYANPSPNTVILNLLGVQIILNEQSTTQDATSISMFTNAVHISLSDYLLNGKLINGDIILGHSQASVTGYSGTTPVTPAPEPTTWTLMVLGFGAIGHAMRSRRRGEALATA